MLTVAHLPPGRYDVLVEGRALGSFGEKQLAAGLNIASATADGWEPGGPWDAAASVLISLTDARDQIANAERFLDHYLPTHPDRIEIHAQSREINGRIEALAAHTAQAPAVPFRRAAITVQVATVRPGTYRLTADSGTLAAGRIDPDPDQMRVAGKISRNDFTFDLTGILSKAATAGSAATGWVNTRSPRTGVLQECPRPGAPSYRSNQDDRSRWRPGPCPGECRCADATAESLVAASSDQIERGPTAASTSSNDASTPSPIVLTTAPPPSRMASASRMDVLVNDAEGPDVSQVAVKRIGLLAYQVRSPSGSPSRPSQAGRVRGPRRGKARERVPSTWRAPP